ncbi:MAG: GGDEF domain-containing protein [Denitromonas halophila]|nr:MAG: GGDEF domain-containing protein [Denitromonas halophila]TVT72970.1 MAG: GGDEF domain-containing protein [Denitromonas halophila]TVT75583.1 MAG: GGDEF domain-containing protein [Denitromonas halophila]
MGLPSLPDALDALESVVVAEFDANMTLHYGNAGLRRLLSDENIGAWQLFAEPMLIRFDLPDDGIRVCFEGLITVNGPGDRMSSLRGRIEADPQRLRVVAGYDLDHILTATDTLMEVNAALVTTQRELARANHQLTRSEATIRRLSLTDPLTGIANRRALDSHTQETFANGDADDTPVWLIIADIDHFKHVNDTWGHDAGDQALTAVAAALREQSRDSDFVARFGGEEFVILAPGLSRNAVCTYAERLRQGIENIDLPLIGRITLSFGVARRHTDDTGRDLFARADAALYRAKANGRNRVEIADNRAPAATETPP